MSIKKQREGHNRFSLFSTHFYLLFLCLINKVYAVGLNNDTAGGCLPSTGLIATRYPGFNIEFYHYFFASYNETLGYGQPDFITYNTNNYVAGGYADQGSFGSTSGVNNVTYSYSPPGYFVPPVSGYYTFYLKYIDDLGVLSIGADSAFKCCLEDSTNTDGTYQIRSIWTSAGPSGTNSIKLELTANVYYPMRLLYNNRQGLGGIEFGYIGTDGVYTDDFSGVIYNLESAAETCDAPGGATTTYTPWTGKSTSTIGTSIYTFEGSDGIPTTSTIFTVETPEYDAVITTYTPWTGTYTSTIGTSVTTSIGSDGIPTTSTIYTVETPEVEGTTTTYTPWTGTYTSTIGTSVTTSVGSDGITTTSTIYTVETPEVEGTTTTYTPWTGTYTSTIGTSVTTSVGSDGIPTTSTIYTVETPEVEGTTTTYTPWTDSRS
ncbi:uncharacterized protein SCODWIG_03800 [Saccharomycodes ludwigii]|uniref:PA14 domain-containing protein n=1 Tax=Saccharomycodes ludwigii TaxID=36035 RepID=A0A376BBH3_9ASCO|nr:uncharacterized protein SCODWIG_03800 [Saccharomycodes ludwigii]